MAALSIISPITILIAAAAGALAAYLSLPWWGIVLTVAFVWGAKVVIGSRIARASAARPARIDPFALREPWRLFVKDAITSQRRFDRSLRSVQEGPLADRLEEIGLKVQRGVSESWEIAQRGQRITDARREIDIDSARHNVAEPGAHPSVVEAADSEIVAHDRLAAREDQLKTSLEILDARLAEAVARAAEMSTRDQLPESADSITAAIDDVVNELESLRLGLDSLGGSP